MKNSPPTVVWHSSYIDLSEQLRARLELTIDTLDSQSHYFADTDAGSSLNGTTDDILRNFIIGASQYNKVKAGKVVRAIKTWFNMYYADRLLVIEKFRKYYFDRAPGNGISKNSFINTIFCRLFINEFIGILAETKWQPLNNPVGLN